MTDMVIRFCAGRGTARGGMAKISSLVKDQYVNECFKVNTEDRTAIVRLFMNAFKKCDPNDYYKAKRIRHFLKRFYLSRAEIHAILFHIGFRYSSKPCSNPVLRNIHINSYHNHKTKT